MREKLKVSLIFCFLILPSLVFGSVNVSVNGTTYTIPQTNEKGWGTNVTSWIQAMSLNTLQPVGGTFTLTNDIDFGGSFGLKPAYIKSRSANPSSAGLLRVSVGDSIGWRNNANSGNLLLAINGSDQLTFNSAIIPTITPNQYGVVVSGAGSAMTVIAPDASTTKVLTSNGTGAAPSWQNPVTGFVNPMTTGGDLIYGGSSGTPTRLANGSSGQLLSSAGGTSAPTWKSLATPTVQTFLSTGTQTGWIFTISSGNATVGATYTNNAHTFTVLSTVASSTLVWMSGTGSLSGSTLTKATGTGDSTLTFTSGLTFALATYTTPANALYLKIKMVGGGAGGSGSGTSGFTAGGTGTVSSFGNAYANGGTNFTPSSGGVPAGGTASLGSYIGAAITGTTGGGGGFNATSGAWATGGMGANAPYFSGGGWTTASTNTGQGAVTNTGGGGGGAWNGPASNSYGGIGGGSGGFVEATVNNPAATYPYVVGQGGGGGLAGAGGSAGGSGAAGQIIVEEYYQ